MNTVMIVELILSAFWRALGGGLADGCRWLVKQIRPCPVESWRERGREAGYTRLSQALLLTQCSCGPASRVSYRSYAHSSKGEGGEGGGAAYRAL